MGGIAQFSAQVPDFTHPPPRDCAACGTRDIVMSKREEEDYSLCRRCNHFRQDIEFNRQTPFNRDVDVNYKPITNVVPLQPPTPPPGGWG